MVKSRHPVPLSAALAAQVKRKLCVKPRTQLREVAVHWLLRQGVAYWSIQRSSHGYSLHWPDGDGGQHVAFLRLGRLQKPTRARNRGGWRFDLRSPNNGTPRTREHPTFWLLSCALARPYKPGGSLVIPDCVLPPHWQVINVPQMLNSWLWRFWEQYQCFATYPDVPEELVGSGHFTPR